MTKGKIGRLREAYHDTLFKHVLRVNESGAPNNADGGSRSSVKTAKGIIERNRSPYAPAQVQFGLEHFTCERIV